MIIRLLGSMVLAGILMAIPILTTLSFALSWDGFWRTLLTFFSLFEYMMLADRLYDSEV